GQAAAGLAPRLPHGLVGQVRHLALEAVAHPLQQPTVLFQLSLGHGGLSDEGVESTPTSRVHDTAAPRTRQGGRNPPPGGSPIYPTVAGRTRRTPPWGSTPTCRTGSRVSWDGPAGCAGRGGGFRGRGRRTGFSLS